MAHNDPNRKKFADWIVQVEFLKFHVDQIRQLTPDNPVMRPDDDLQRINLVRSIFDFFADVANRKCLSELATFRAILLMKIEEARAKPLYDPIKDSIDRLYDIIMAIG
jgi:hypothetical protein